VTANRVHALAERPVNVSLHLSHPLVPGLPRARAVPLQPSAPTGRSWR
jgi:hypothetical protein